MTANEEHIGLLIRKLSVVLDRASNKNVGKVGITRAQVHVLAELSDAQKQTLSFSQLKDRLDVTQPGAWGLVNRLEAKGMVRTRTDPNDARAKLVTITDAGRKAFAGARTYMDDLESMLTAGIDQEDVAFVRACLQRMYANCDGC